MNIISLETMAWWMIERQINEQKYQWLSQNITSIFIDSSKISTLEYYKALFKNIFKNKMKVNIYE